MAKIVLRNVASGYNRQNINRNFEDLVDILQNKVLFRDNPDGEPNSMLSDLDMNSQKIINVYVDWDDDDSLVDVGGSKQRFVQRQGDSMSGDLDMQGNTVTGLRESELSTDAVRKQELDAEIAQRVSSDNNLQEQISGGAPLEASAFSPISWHKQVIENSLTIPDNKNAWSFGPEVEIAAGVTVEIGEGSYWTIADGNVTS